MYRIGEFSKISNLTVKALRYYDEEGILVPSSRGENDYRLYDEKDFRKAQLIVLLRKLEFSIAEIRDVMKEYEGEEDLQYFLGQKKEMLLQHMEHEKALIRQLDTQIRITDQEMKCMQYQIEEKEIGTIMVAGIRFQGTYQEMSKYIGNIFREVKGLACGAPLNLYYDEEYREKADIEVCVPIHKQFEGKQVKCHVLEPVRAVSTVHVGPYNRLNEAYKAVVDYIKAHGYEALVPGREIYEKGPGAIFAGNPNKYRTIIQIPVKRMERGE